MKKKKCRRLAEILTEYIILEAEDNGVLYERNGDFVNVVQSDDLEEIIYKVLRHETNI
jgi:hypothetical protein